MCPPLLSLAMSVSVVLYDLPVSNHGARVRLLLYKKSLEAEVPIASPAELGGLASAHTKVLSFCGKPCKEAAKEEHSCVAHMPS
ncbi:hypothetical protein AB1Y20_016734 [Prymnesium parvum]|uniref:Uncharacterized protein n=1 Tax=Prymnesium parvum TaxID=97485 RepID=A0AB34ICY0_PRYPA